MSFQLELQYLRAVTPFSAKEDVRHYLCGVLFHVDQQGNLRLVASDGFTMAIVGTPSSISDTALFNTETLLEGKVLADIAKSRLPWLEVTPGDRTWQIGDRLVPVMQGVYPDWRRMIPKELPEPEASTFDPDLLKPFGVAAKAFGSKPRDLALHQRGPREGIVIGLPGHRFFGLLMPYRGQNQLTVSEFTWAQP